MGHAGRVPAIQEETTMSSKKTKGLGFEGWLNRLKNEFSVHAEEEDFDPTRPMDDLAKLRRLMVIDRRYMYAMMGSRSGRTSQATVQEFKAIASDYEQLLEAGPPQSQFYKEDDVRTKIADAIRSAAQSCENLRDYTQAAELYRSAAGIYKTAGNPNGARRCQERLAELLYVQDGRVDSEIQRLRVKMAKAAANSIEHAEALIELGTLYSNNGDDHEAKDLLEKAERILHAQGGDPSGAVLADALSASLLSLTGGKPGSGPTQIETKMRMQGLYRQLYTALARIHQATNPSKAAEYRAKTAQRDSREYNDDFTQSMLQMLHKDLAKL
jgi:tetratricopeptide (TPR) repeat protein